MTALIAAVLVLLLGAAGCLLPLRNATRAGIGVASQGVATALALWAVVPVLAGGASLAADLPWAYPVGTLRLRLDALGAFFLAWSLPMTLLGSLYAVGYLKPAFRQSTRNVGLHFALLNITARSSFIVVYTERSHAVLSGRLGDWRRWPRG